MLSSALQMEFVRLLFANQCFDSLHHAGSGSLYNPPCFHCVQMLTIPSYVYFQPWQDSFPVFCHHPAQYRDLDYTLQILSALQRRWYWSPETKSFALVPDAWSGILLLWQLKSDWSPALSSNCLWARLDSCLQAAVRSHWLGWVELQEVIHEVALHSIAFDWLVQSCFLGALRAPHSN